MISFNDEGEFRGGFDIMNLVTFPNNSFQRVKVGKVDANEEKEFIINEDIIVWHKRFNQVGIVRSPDGLSLPAVGNLGARKKILFCQIQP